VEPLILGWDTTPGVPGPSPPGLHPSHLPPLGHMSGKTFTPAQAKWLNNHDFSFPFFINQRHDARLQ
jgi:hypothetical protein